MAKRKFMTFNDFIAANVNERANRNVGLSLSLSLSFVALIGRVIATVSS